MLPKDLHNKENEPIAIHGFQQVVDMLQIADQPFREALLKKISLKDPVLARKLQQHLQQQTPHGS